MNKPKLLLLICASVLTSSILSIADQVPVRRKANDYSRIFDITHKITSELPIWKSNNGLGNYIWLTSSIKNGSISNNSEFKLPTHIGTHVDAPSHFFDKYYEEGFDVTTLPLEVLNGPALLVDVPRSKNITAEVMQSLNIPNEVRRVLFRTLNTDRRLMYKKEFDSSFTGFTADGAEWLVQNTHIQFVGLDYVSVSAFVDAVPVHATFLKDKRVIPLEGAKLDNIEAGLYDLHCLPIMLVGGDGGATRCILMK